MGRGWAQQSLVPSPSWETPLAQVPDCHPCLCSLYEGGGWGGTSHLPPPEISPGGCGGKIALNLFLRSSTPSLLSKPGVMSVIFLFYFCTRRQHVRELSHRNTPLLASEALHYLDVPPSSLAAPSQSPLSTPLPILTSQHWSSLELGPGPSSFLSLVISSIPTALNTS